MIEISEQIREFLKNTASILNNYLSPLLRSTIGKKRTTPKVELLGQ